MRKQLLNLKHLLRRAGLALVALMLAAGPVHADIWGYVDDKGVAHFAAEKLDDRYELYFKNGQNFDTQEGVPAQAASAVVVPAETRPLNAQPSLPPKLQTFFDVSPNFKAVKHHIREASNLHKIDFELLQALIATESGFDTSAVSPKGAVGLMQLMPPTAQRYGVKGDAKTPIEKKLTDPRTNIRAGTRYLSDLMLMFPGKLELALAAYNAGEGAVKRYGNQIPPYKETQNYVKTIMQMYATLKPPALLAKRLAEVKAVQIAKPPTRVHMVIGGAARRGNMVPPAEATLPAQEITPPDKSTLVLQALPGVPSTGVQ
jgi:soluble lytic murein transglycosylase-like protein